MEVPSGPSAGAPVMAAVGGKLATVAPPWPTSGAIPEAEIVVVIEPGEVKERAGSFTNDAGEKVDYEKRTQEARLETCGYAYPYEVRLEKGQPAFKPGRYVMNVAKMLTVNKGVHGISKYPVLEAVAAAPSKAA